MKTFRLESEAWCLFVSFSAESLCIRPIFLQHLFHFFGVDLVMQDGDENTVNHLLIFAGLMPLHVLPIDMPPFWFLFSRPLQGSRPCRSNFILKNSQRNHRNNKPDLFSTSKLFSLSFVFLQAPAQRVKCKKIYYMTGSINTKKSKTWIWWPCFGRGFVSPPQSHRSAWKSS